MPKLEDLEGYAEAKARYDGEITAAKAAGDELAELRAELAWRNQLDQFREKLAQIEARERAVAEAKAAAKQRYPRAPEAVYASLNDPEAIEQAARTAHEAIEAAIPQQAQAPAPAQAWPQPPAGGPPQPPLKHPFDDPKNWNEALQRAINTAGQTGMGFDAPAQKALRDYVLEKLWESSPNERTTR